MGNQERVSTGRSWLFDFDTLQMREASRVRHCDEDLGRRFPSYFTCLRHSYTSIMDISRMD
jgi:hypothetical protein